MTLEIDIRRPLGALDLAATFSARNGVTALFGRSGAGKTSIVNCIAGLLRPASGRIAVDGEPLFDSAARIDVPRHRRRIGYVFQDARLFPHLTVRRNLLYGRWFARGEPRQGRDGFDEVVDLLGIEPLLARRPGTLSGGEKQRVAIGRALLARPRLLLMDEPLASLDHERRQEILPYLDRLCASRRVPIVLVSHAVEEVARLATTVVLVSDGRVAAFGPVDEIMARLDLGPLTGRAEAGVVLPARVVEHDARYRLSLLDLAGQPLLVPAIEEPPGTRLRLRIRARDVVLALRPVEDISIRNQLRGRIADIRSEPGTFAEVAVDVGGAILRARVTRLTVAELALAPGREVMALVKAVALERRLMTPVVPADP